MLVHTPTSGPEQLTHKGKRGQRVCSKEISLLGLSVHPKEAWHPLPRERAGSECMRLVYVLGTEQTSGWGYSPVGRMLA